MITSVQRYINEALEELRHVRWPTRQQAVRLSAIVLAFTGAAALFFGIADIGLAQLIRALLAFS
jgi:preprotein translocase SecE subunit